MAWWDYLILFGILGFIFLIRDRIVALVKDVIFAIVIYIVVVFLLGMLGLRMPTDVVVNGLFITIIAFTILHIILNKSMPHS